MQFRQIRIQTSIVHHKVDYVYLEFKQVKDVCQKQREHTVSSAHRDFCVHLFMCLLCLIGPCLIEDMIFLASILELLLEVSTRLLGHLGLLSINKYGKLIKVLKQSC